MSTSHVVAHDGTRRPFGFECLHCGALLGITLPVSVDEFVSGGEAFFARHLACPPAPDVPERIDAMLDERVIPVGEPGGAS